MMKKTNKKLLCGILSGLAAMSIAAGAGAAELETTDDKMQSFVLDTLVVTGSRIPVTITESKADISVVSRKQIEQMHMETVEEALRTVPGVQFLNYGPNGVNANLSGLRINGSKDIVVLVDGVRVTDFQGSGNSGYMYAAQLSNMDNIERIEVLRGSAGTIYGSGAKGGVINIITRDVDKLKTQIDISRGSFGHESYKFNTQGKRDKLAWNIYYNKSLTGDMKDGDGKHWDSSSDNKSSGIKLVYDFNDKNKLTVNYDKIKSDYSGEDVIYANHYNGGYESETLTIRHDLKINDEWSNSLTYRNSDVTSNYTQLAPNGKVAFSTHGDNTYNFLSDQVTYKLDRNTLIFGLDYSKGEDNRMNASMENYSYYVQDDWEFIPHVTLSGGLRYDDPDRDGSGAKLESHTSKSYKLSWDITDNDILYAGRSDFYILPSITQLYDSQYGNGNLKPAEGRTSSIGYSKKFDDYNVFTFNWFKTESSTTIGYDGSGSYQNYDDGVSRGWNAQYMTQLGDHWNINFGWAHLFQYASGDNYSLGYYPKDMATFSVFYDYAKVNVGLDGFYFMRKKNAQNSAMQGWPKDDYGVYNLSVNYSPTKNLTFYGKVNNIFDEIYAEHTDVIWGGQPGTWYSMPGRSFVVGMQLKF